MNKKKDSSKSKVEESKKALVFFRMEGCGHCESMKPEWKKLSEMGEYKEFHFVDTESKEDAKLLEKHEIQGFPTIKLCKNGVEDVSKCVVL